MAKAPSPPPVSFRYSLTIDGIEIGQFADASLTSEVPPVEFFEGGERIPKVMPGRPKPSIVVLTRGHSTNMTMFVWHEQVVLNPTDARKNCTLLVTDQLNRPVARYHLTQAWPSKIDIADLDIGTNEALFEITTLVCDHITRVAV